MHAIAGVNRSFPGADRERGQLCREILAEFLDDIGRRYAGELAAEQQRVAEHERIDFRSGSQTRERAIRVACDTLATSRGIEVHLREREHPLDTKDVLMCGEIILQLLLRRLSASRYVFGNELQFLTQTTADHGVVLVESKRNRFTCRDFLADVVANQTVHFLAGWPALPGSGERRRQHRDLCLRDDNLVGARGFVLRHERIRAENQRAECDEMQQRLAQKAHHFARSCLAGVYQIGEVYARSVVSIGTSLGIWMPKYFASYAVQRGVGISITRP